VNKLNIKEQFNLIADEYDNNRKKFISCFMDFYGNTTNFIASNITAPKSVIDLGAGTGLLTYFWYQRFPDSRYLLIDIADEMLNTARRRFFGIGNITYQILNYVDELNALTDKGFDMVISALSIHHLEDSEKANLFLGIYNALPEGGLLVNYDQFCAGQPEMDDWFDRYWEYRLSNSGLTDRDIVLWKERRKLDRECSVEQETEMLKESGFKVVKCVYSYQKFAVITAVKAGDFALCGERPGALPLDPTAL